MLLTPIVINGLYNTLRMYIQTGGRGGRNDSLYRKSTGLTGGRGPGRG